MYIFFTGRYYYMFFFFVFFYILILDNIIIIMRVCTKYDCVRVVAFRFCTIQYAVLVARRVVVVAKRIRRDKTVILNTRRIYSMYSQCT